MYGYPKRRSSGSPISRKQSSQTGKSGETRTVGRLVRTLSRMVKSSNPDTSVGTMSNDAMRDAAGACDSIAPRKPGSADRRAFDVDLDAGLGVEHPAVQTVRASEPVDERAEADALHDPGDAYVPGLDHVRAAAT